MCCQSLCFISFLASLPSFTRAKLSGIRGVGVGVGGLIKAGRDGGVVDRADPRVEGAEPGRFVALVPPHDEVEPN